MNLIIPLASYKDWQNNAEVFYPKYLYEINNTPLIEYVVNNLMKIRGITSFTFILSNDDCIKFQIDKTIKLLIPDCKIVRLQNRTKGSICSILMAIDHINFNDECLILNADQIFVIDLNQAIFYFRSTFADGGLIYFRSIHPRWSYAEIENEFVIRTEEKKPISRNALTGFYYFKTFASFVDNAFEVILNDERNNDSFFTSTVINYLILKGLEIRAYKIDEHNYFTFYDQTKIEIIEKMIIKNGLNGYI